MLKEDDYKEIVGKFEEKFNGFIDVIKSQKRIDYHSLWSNRYLQIYKKCKNFL